VHRQFAFGQEADFGGCWKYQDGVESPAMTVVLLTKVVACRLERRRQRLALLASRQFKELRIRRAMQA
jgi:hypothetical protein